MWKTIYSIDFNLLIGIIGGIVSGIFVSYVFLIEAEFRNQFNHVKAMFTSIYGITATYSAYEHFQKQKAKNVLTKLKRLIMPVTSLVKATWSIFSTIIGVSFLPFSSPTNLGNINSDLTKY